MPELLDQGVATRDDIDKTLKLGMNHPMGPLQLGAWSCFRTRLILCALICANDRYDSRFVSHVHLATFNRTA